MYLSRLIIKNYRSIRYLDIPFSRGKNVIVGKNNAGKSNIVKALNLVLGEKYPTYADISENDFFTSDGQTADSFWIFCVLKGDDINADLINECKGIWSGQLSESPLKKDDKKEVALRLPHAIPDPDEYWPQHDPRKKYYKKPGEKDQLLSGIRGKSICFLFYAKPERDEENSYLKEFRLFYRKDNEWHTSWNLSKEIRDAFLTSAIVDSFRETSKQLKISSYSWYGKLIKQIWEKSKRKPIVNSSSTDEDMLICPFCQQQHRDADLSCSYEEALNQKFKQIAKLTDGIFSDVAGNIQEKIDISFDGTKISFQLTADNKADIHKTTQIYVDDGFKSLLTDKGSGIQSAVVINLFSYYCHTFHNNTSLLVIEEPELYLHPQARRALAQKLENFIGLKPEKENQVIVTTHSSEFIAADKSNGITIVKKENCETKAKHYNFKGIDPKELKTLLKSENNEMFFADKVILVEGAEKYLIPIIADLVINERGDLEKEEKNVLDNKNISVIRAGGKHEFPKYMKILKECQIDYYILADRDCFFNGLKAIFGEEMGISQDEKQEILKFAKEIVDKSPKAYGEMQKVKERTIQPDKSIDAKTLCGALAALQVSQDKEVIDSLLGIWEHIYPQIMEKDVDAYMRETNSYKTFLNHRKTLWDSNIFILEKGELDDYLTDKGMQVDGSKEMKVINIIREIDPEKPIELESFLKLAEFKVFLGKVLATPTNPT